MKKCLFKNNRGEIIELDGDLTILDLLKKGISIKVVGKDESLRENEFASFPTHELIDDI